MALRSQIIGCGAYLPERIVTNNDLWIAAAGWGIVIFLLGIVFFWQAEALYGRG